MIEYPEISPAPEEPGPIWAPGASGAPRSTTASPAWPAHCIQASMPAFICSGVALAIWSRAEVEDRYNTMNLVISSPLVLSELFPPALPGQREPRRDGSTEPSLAQVSELQWRGRTIGP